MKKENPPIKVQTGIIISALKKKAKPTLARILLYEVKDKDDYNLLAQKVSVIKAWRKEAEDKLEEIVGPNRAAIALNKQSVKAATELFQPFFTDVDEAEQTAKAAMIKFLDKADEQVKQLDKDLQSGKIKKVATVLKGRADLAVNNEFASVRHLKTLQIVSLKKIPLKFMVPDETAILKELRAGKAVPGCKLVKTKSIAI